MEFGASVLGAEAPMDGGLSGVAPGLVGVDGFGQRHPSPWGPQRQSQDNTLNSISAMLSQLACLGVW